VLRRLGVSLLIGLSGQAAPAGSPALGQPVTAEDLSRLAISVFPDGAGLPPGRGTATDGQALFQTKCAGCHGLRGSGGSADELAGGAHGLRGEPPDKTVGTYWPYATTLFDYIRRAMPADAPRSLSDDEVYALTAYVLSLNGIVDSAASLDAPTLTKVTMPNRDGFIRIDAR